MARQKSARSVKVQISATLGADNTAVFTGNADNG